MRVRVDSAFVGSVLFTVALLSLLPDSWNLALTRRGKSWLQEPDVWFREAGRLYGELGVTCLTIILIGLIVTWGAYVKSSKWAWLVMLVLTWGWAFPIFVLPLRPGHWVLPFREMLYDALYHSGGSRIAVETLLTFSSMVLALLLPLPSFIRTGERQPDGPLAYGRQCVWDHVAVDCAWAIGVDTPYCLRDSTGRTTRMADIGNASATATRQSCR